MKANKHLLLWSSLAALVVLVWAAVHENYLSDWRVIQRQIQARLPASEADAFSLQLRQIVSREWAHKSGAALRVLSPRSGQTYVYLWNSFA